MGMDCCVPLSEAACQSRRHLTAVSHSTYLHKGADRLAAGVGTTVAVTHDFTGTNPDHLASPGTGLCHPDLTSTYTSTTALHLESG